VHYWAFARLNDADRSRWLHIALVFLSNDIPLEEQWPVLRTNGFSATAKNHSSHALSLMDTSPGLELPLSSQNVISVLCAASPSQTLIISSRRQALFQNLSRRFQDPAVDVMFQLWILIDSENLSCGLTQWHVLQKLASHVQVNNSQRRSGMLNSLLLHYAFQLSTIIICQRPERLMQASNGMQKHSEGDDEALSSFIAAWKETSDSYLERRAKKLRDLYWLARSRPDEFIIDLEKKYNKTSQL
jgi:hypothetical protein